MILSACQGKLMVRLECQPKVGAKVGSSKSYLYLDIKSVWSLLWLDPCSCCLCVWMCPGRDFGFVQSIWSQQWCLMMLCEAVGVPRRGWTALPVATWHSSCQQAPSMMLRLLIFSLIRSCKFEVSSCPVFNGSQTAPKSSCILEVL